MLRDGINPYYDGTAYEVVFENGTSIEVPDNYTEFIATRNGTYTINGKTVEGKKLSTTIEITDIVEEKFSEIYDETYTYTDTNGKTATIPAGFAVGTSSTVNTIENGLVITDAVDSEGYSIGNEFVWIPVESEDDLDGYETEVEEYNEMKKQVLAYNGFYIGRYETGDATNGVKERTEKTEAHKVAIKKGITPYNYIELGESNQEIGTNGAVYLSQNMYKDSTSVTSTLCYVNQWEAMCRFLGECPNSHTAIGPWWYKCTLTGLNKEDVHKNLFGLCSNVNDLTMESDRFGICLLGKLL